MSDETALVRVRTCQGWDLAQIFKSKLEAAGIPVLLKYESAGLVFGITVDGLGEVKIMVPEAHAHEAQSLLREQDDEDAPDDDAYEDDHPGKDSSIS
jgi:hypothetical protein